MRPAERNALAITTMRPVKLRGFNAAQVACVKAPSTTIRYDPTESRLLLDQISQAMDLYVGDNPLSNYDSAVALLETDSFDLWCLPSDRAIYLTRGFLDAITFIECTYQLVRMANSLKHHASRNNLERPDFELFVRSILTLQTSRLTLHIVGERPAPRLFGSFGPEQQIKSGHIVDLTLAFTLLHEQAHIELDRQPDLLEKWMQKTNSTASSRASLDEEFFADSWALEQIQIQQRTQFFKPALLLFVNQWLVDLIVYAADGTHPAALTRLSRLARTQFEGQEGAELSRIAQAFAESQRTSINTLSKIASHERLQIHLEQCRAIAKKDDGRIYEETAIAIAERYEALARDGELD